MGTSASELAAATPSSRDRYVDLLRVVALAMVMLGHFLMAGVERLPDGGISIGNSLVTVPEARVLTWLFQVMPVFFVVGGFSHFKAWRTVQRRNGSFADFADARARRLLEPTAVFVAFGVMAGVLVEVGGQGHISPQVEFALRIVGQPLWFVGIYLGVVAFATTMMRLHDRFGVAVVVVLVAAVAVVDVLHLGFDLPWVGYLNFMFVWLACHQLGFFWADGRLLRRGVAPAMAVLGGVTAVVLVAFGPYPVSMVSLPGEQVSNLVPPSAALLALGFCQIGVLLLLRDAGNRWLQRPKVWTAVVFANGVVMTTFLWHLTAVVVVNAVVVNAGLPVPVVASTVWWLSRLVLLTAVLVVLAALVLVFRRFEVRPTADVVPVTERRGHRDGWATLGLVGAILGVLGFSVTGFTGVTTLATQTLVVLPMTPFLNLALLLAGWWTIELASRPRRSPGSAAPSLPAGPTSGRGRSG